MKYFIGIDNGVSGTIGAISKDGKNVHFEPVPVKKEQNYTKSKAIITRIDSPELWGLFDEWKVDTNSTILIERPMVNPGRWKATVSAIRALEATLVFLESEGYKHMYIDSKEWQKVMLPSGLKGPAELKKASLDIGNRIFPAFKDHKHEDRDGLLMAEFARRVNL